MNRITPYDWQTRLMVEPLTQVLRKENTGILAGAVGSGKTICGLQVFHNLGYVPFVAAPKATLLDWHETAEAMGIQIVDALNVEKLRTGNTEYLNRLGDKFTWKLRPQNVGLIIDEAHDYTGRGTLNAEVAKAADKLVQLTNGQVSHYRLKVLLMSATLADSSLKFADALGYLLKFHGGDGKSGQWLMQHGCYINRWNGYDFPKKGEARKRALKKLSASLFPRFGVCVKHEDIPNFPENQIITKHVEIQPKELKELQAVYDVYETMSDDVKSDIAELDRLIAEMDCQSEQDILEFKKFGKKGTALLRARQMSELAKVPQIHELGSHLIEEGGSIVLFVSFKATFEALTQKFKKFNPSLIYGTDSNGRSQKDHERQAAKKRFLNDETRVCIVMIQAGGVGISLNDIHGVYPRYSIMSPPVRMVHYKQALGRIHRANSKSKSIQYVLIAKDTAEEKLEQSLQVKCENLDLITDGWIE